MERREPHQAARFNLTPEPCSHGPFKGYARLDRISSAARKGPDQKFKALVPQFTVENLRQAFRSLDGSKAVGIDQITKDHYAKDLEANLTLLADRISRGGWKPQPSREVLIPKANGGTRPLAIGCLEDKIVQQLGAKILEAIYEDSFHANIYLDVCLDSWFEKNWGQNAQMIRYADDAVFVFTDTELAEQFKRSLADRFEGFKLKMNDEKSGIVNFNLHSPESEIQFLGFHLYWGSKSVSSPKKLLKVKTSPKKLGKSIEAYGDWIKAKHSKLTLDKIWEQTAQKLRGHYSYYGLIFNRPKLNHFYFAIVGALFKWLNRRSQKRSYTWDGFAKRLRYKPLPKPTAAALIDITSGIVPELKRKMKSRMRKSRTYGSVRSPGLSPVFT
jgi:Reverse transcriptase (RNA-dependent DNA polymerase)